MTMLEALHELRDRIESGWTQGAMARRGDTPCGAADPRATSWCLLGAMSVSPGFPDKSIGVALRKEIDGQFMSLGSFNDSHTKEEVLALIDRAIATAKG